ncbi:hypothetical protein LEP1GSC061_3020 [Leptospira wolffii serovar Khorat str. Khorat-H2]|nr:hypothetical protein LEP1GSC061_3020 [Leptospira wolffii serovar Khorat str. Khorat-H2]
MVFEGFFSHRIKPIFRLMDLDSILFRPELRILKFLLRNPL